jgi:hypothetical protein
MKTSHEAQVEIRDLLPTILDVNQKLTRLYGETVGPTGPQGLSLSPQSDISSAFQYLDGARNVLKEIADHFKLPLPDRSGPSAKKLKAIEEMLLTYLKMDTLPTFTRDGKDMAESILKRIRE